MNASAEISRRTYWHLVGAVDHLLGGSGSQPGVGLHRSCTAAPESQSRCEYAGREADTNQGNVEDGAQSHSRAIEPEDKQTSRRIDKPFHATVKDELILSAGAVKSPHLLPLAGISDASYLSFVGVTSLVNLPDVGQNLQDHVFLPMSWTVSSNDTLDSIRLKVSFASELFHEWNTTRTGALADGPANVFGWLRATDNSSIFSSTTDPSAGPTSAHFECIFSDEYVSRVQMPLSEGHFFTVIVNLISHASRGNTILGSLDPLDKPIIDLNFLSAPRSCVKGSKRPGVSSRRRPLRITLSPSSAVSRPRKRMKSLSRGRSGAPAPESNPPTRPVIARTRPELAGRPQMRSKAVFGNSQAVDIDFFYIVHLNRL
ncbi:GMC oxidoreductase [Peniophora sp. CONT]|nr:GMC oxidoreductase [Peniophora sp. CONT]